MDDQKKDQQQAVEIEIDYDSHSIKRVVGLPEGTEVRLFEYDPNHGTLVNIYRVTEGTIVYQEQCLPCPNCGEIVRKDELQTGCFAPVRHPAQHKKAAECRACGCPLQDIG